MLPVIFQLILYYGLLVVHGVRVDLHTGAEADVANGPTHQLEVAEKLQRYRALNETLMNRYMAGADIPLVDSSFLEDDITSYHLPRQWRNKLQVVKKLGEGSFGKVFQCRVLCESSKDVSVSVKLIVDKDDPQVRNEIQILKQMRGVSEFCISAVGEPPYIENSDGIWLMMPYMNGGELLDFLNRCQTSPGCLYGDPEGRKDWTQLNPLYTTPYILGLFSDIVQGVEALHAKAGRLHIDLKPANVMLNCRGEKCFAAVIDLGLDLGRLPSVRDANLPTSRGLQTQPPRLAASSTGCVGTGHHSVSAPVPRPATILFGSPTPGEPLRCLLGRQHPQNKES
ncbi:mkcE [Symbiodinium natans]|uniref:non-specific serine/threonine protein kinase n=1 Tax=Symbiodinium natans TaxID=878477 RepID=A0A812U2D8_9DINO|nr:mkcE [Symbiodinium natans]